MPHVIRKFYGADVIDMTDPDLFRVPSFDALHQILDDVYEGATGYDKDGIRRAHVKKFCGTTWQVTFYGPRGRRFREDKKDYKNFGYWHYTRELLEYAWFIKGFDERVHALRQLALQSYMLPVT